MAVGLGVLLNEANYTVTIKEAAQSRTLIYLSGVLTLARGLAILNVRRLWTADQRVAITILAWLMAIGGVVRIVLPRFTATLAVALYSTPAGLTAFAVAMRRLPQFRRCRA